MDGTRQPLSLDAVREKLDAAGGRGYWRSLEELSESEGFEEMLHREFPSHASEWISSLDRRSFLKMMAASLALAGLSSCARQPSEKIVPYVRTPEELVPGRPLFFASASVHEGYAVGTLVRSDMGRPTKVEGNPRHPASLGATDLFAQAAILSLYDPDRSKTVTYQGEIRTWESFADHLLPAMGLQNMTQGSGLRILTETVTSPSVIARLQELLRRLPGAQWHQYQAHGRMEEREAARVVFGEDVQIVHRFDQADVVVAFDSDFLMSGPASVRYQHDFAVRRRLMGSAHAMNRLYAFESTPTNTGAMADHRVPVRSVDLSSYVQYVAARLGVQGVAAGKVPDHHQPLLDAMISDLRSCRGKGIVIAGETQPAAVHALVMGINDVLNNAGSTVHCIEPAAPERAGLRADSIRALVDDLNNGKVQLLLILGGNPAFDMPADVDFSAAARKAPMSVRLGQYHDETSFVCKWHLPEAHPLEAWGDARAFDGTASIIQPLIAPLHEGRSAHDLLNLLLGEGDRSAYDVIREYWKSIRPAGFEESWTQWLNEGLIPGSASQTKAVTFSASGLSSLSTSLPPADGMEVVFRADPTVGDGRWANNGWLQELPKPITKITWDNAVLLSFATARNLGVTSGDIVSIRLSGREIEGPVFVVPGNADNSATLHTGYGRTRAGQVGNGTGFDVFKLRTLGASGCTGGAEIRKTGRTYSFACTQQHHSMEERHPVRVATLEEYAATPAVIAEQAPEEPAKGSLYPGHPGEGYQWGMAIDLNACTGCGVCTIACQSENNIPIVGKEGVFRNREMHWIRVDQYFDGTIENPAFHPQPLACQHCENAPCEVVCPVGATVHDHEGLNVMVYNRCVGTRYCSNNCPYKVRRFNFLEYNGSDDPLVKMMKNPEVTVRSRGVMEKCTYCVQRITNARIAAEKDDRTLHDGEVVTACQAACPSQAIMFGDVNDDKSKVRQWKAEPRAYGLLAELNTRPRTSFLARLKNPNPEVQEKAS